MRRNRPKNKNIIKNICWILDPGHGGMINNMYQTAGKRSPVWPDGSQLFEGVFNRKVVNLIAQKLQKLSYLYGILVPEEKDISLSERVARVKNLYKSCPNSILISVHGNAGGGTGWEVWTSPGETKSDAIATMFYEKAKEEFPGFKMRADHSDGDPDKESRFYILTKTPCPAILTENFFMDTYEPDCKLMMSATGREKIANMHVTAIKEIQEAFKP